MAALCCPQHSIPLLGTNLWHARAAGICVDVSSGFVAESCTLSWLRSCSLNASVKGLVWNRGVNPQINQIDTFVKSCLPDGQGTPFAYEQLNLSANAEKPAAYRRDDVILACKRLVAKLPPSLKETIEVDALMLCDTLTSLCPNASWLTAQLECVGKNNCARWHQDLYVGRTIITYTGPGTWLVDDNSVDFSQFDKTMGVSKEVSDPLIVPDFNKIHRAQTNAVCLLKGNSWPDINGFGITHKSPNVPLNDKGEVLEKR
ncbi:hypothetical protein TrLO_g10124 [Triparma laevis f. longispina]|nr:hypothetical protein TrLO_g10124 [Triparma laevis f. longispina]